MAHAKAASSHLRFSIRFVNAFITNIRSLSIGCTIKSVFLGCLLYVDDMLLLCPSVKGLQSTLDNCYVIANALKLTFNASKSACLTIGKLAKTLLKEMLLGAERLEWVTAITYLGIIITTGIKVTFNSLQPVTYVYAHAKTLDEIIHLRMQECYC